MSYWRKLNPGQQALLVLVCLRKGETFASLAAGFRVGTATAWRYVEETVALLAARAPRLRKAIRDAASRLPARRAAPAMKRCEGRTNRGGARSGTRVFLLRMQARSRVQAITTQVVRLVPQPRSPPHAARPNDGRFA